MINALEIAWLNFSFYLLFLLFSAVSIPMLSLGGLVCWLFLPKRVVLKRFRRAISFYGTVVIRILPYPLIRIDYVDEDPATADGPLVFVCNHRASSDPFLLACLPFEVVQVVKDWPLRLPVLGAYAKWAGYLSVTEMPFEEFSERAGRLIAESVCLGGFPEGTRSGGLHVSQFTSALFRVALETRCPIVPFCISGNQDVPRRGSLLLRPAVIRIRKLPVIRVADFGDMNAFRLKNHVRDVMVDALAQLDAVDSKQKSYRLIPGGSGR